MSSQDHKQALSHGFRLGSYRVVRVLGVGGFGITYLCEHAGLGVQVAVKEYLPNEIAVRDGTAVLPKSAGDREGFEWGLSRFLDEARTLARFEHPNVVRVRDCFEANSTAYIVMDYEDGESLDRLLQRLDTLTEAQLKRVVLPVAEGLREVHAAGFLHRDVKPSNIFVRRSDESPVLLDFGSARQALGRKTRSMTAIASAGYSPPEQYESQGSQGAWTDIYALCALCHRAITGEVPVEAPRRTGEVARQRADPQEQLAASGVAGYSSGFLEAVDGGLRLIETERPGCLDDWLARMEGSITARNRQAPRRDPALLHEHLQRHRAIARLRTGIHVHAGGRMEEAAKQRSVSPDGSFHPRSHVTAPSTKTTPTKAGIVTRLIRGQFGLAKTYWLFNWVGGIVIGSVSNYLESQSLYLAFLAFFATAILYSVIVVIGTWRAADAYDGWRGWAILAKVLIVVGIVLAGLANLV